MNKLALTIPRAFDPASPESSTARVAHKIPQGNHAQHTQYHNIDLTIQKAGVRCEQKESFEESILKEIYEKSH
jgi:hypothetical protein